jgi:hypothetical protein
MNAVTKNLLALGFHESKRAKFIAFPSTKRCLEKNSVTATYGSANFSD